MENEKIKLTVRLTPEEYGRLKECMDKAGFGTINTYVRKMALNGFVIHVDMNAFQEPVKLMRNISNNINQISARVNSTNNIYAEDVEELKEKYSQLAVSVSQIVTYINHLEE